MGNHQFIQQLNPLKYKTRKQEKIRRGTRPSGKRQTGKTATWNGNIDPRSRCDLIETWWLWLTLPELLKGARWPRPRRLAARPRRDRDIGFRDRDRDRDVGQLFRDETETRPGDVSRRLETETSKTESASLPYAMQKIDCAPYSTGLSMTIQRLVNQIINRNKCITKQNIK